MTQVQFEDYPAKSAMIHAALREIGITEDENVYWYEAPIIDPNLIEKIRTLINADETAQFIPYYAHSWQYSHYQDVLVDGNLYKWRSFHQQFIKFAPSIANSTDGH